MNLKEGNGSPLKKDVDEIRVLHKATKSASEFLDELYSKGFKIGKINK